MKAKALLIAVFLAATNFAWAQGGLDINNAEQHMNASTWAQTQTERDIPSRKSRSISLRSMPQEPWWIPTSSRTRTTAKYKRLA